MRKSYVVIIVLLIIIGYLVLGQKGTQTGLVIGEKSSSTSTTLKSETGKILVLTLYRSGEGESDLAAYVSRGMNYEAKKLANFKQMDVSADPQAISYYGVDILPTTLFVSPSGKTLHRHAGYINKDGLLKILSSLKGR